MESSCLDSADKDLRFSHSFRDSSDTVTELSKCRGKFA